MKLKGLEQRHMWTEMRARTILISGSLDGDLHDADSLFDAVFAAVQDVCSPDEAIRNGRANLSRTARSVGRVLSMVQTKKETE